MDLYMLIKKVVPAQVRSPLRRALNAGGFGGLVKDRWYYEVKDRQDFMRKGFTTLTYNCITGDYVEFGSWSARTFNLAYKEARRIGHNCKLWSFDSFEGLPRQASVKDEHPSWTEGNMSMSLDEFLQACRGIPRDEFEVIKGFYENTIGREASIDSSLPSDIALAYIDCDMHSSTQTVLKFLAKRMKHGMIIGFDDYFCHSSTAIAGERLALLEFLEQGGRFNFLPYVQFGWSGMSFLVEEKRLLPKEISTPVLLLADAPARL